MTVGALVVEVAEGGEVGAITTLLLVAIRGIVARCSESFDRFAKAGKRLGEWAVDGFVMDALAIVRAVDRDSWVLIGHSLGAIIAAKLAEQVSARTTGVIAVDAIKRPDLVMSPESQQEMLDFLAADWPVNQPSLASSKTGVSWITSPPAVSIGGLGWNRRTRRKSSRS